MDSKKITKGCLVRLKGFKGWWQVTSVDGTQVACMRKKGKEPEHLWTDESEVIAVSNKRTKGTK